MEIRSAEFVTSMRDYSPPASALPEIAVAGRWAFSWPIPDSAANLIVMDAADVKGVTDQVDFVFCAVAMDKKATRELEETYAKAETPVVSNNSACRMLPDVPMLIPEINAGHAPIITAQRKRLGTKRGFIAVKPNCSIQSYVPALTPLRDYGLKAISVCTYQAISGAGKTFDRWRGMGYSRFHHAAAETGGTKSGRYDQRAAQ